MLDADGLDALTMRKVGAALGAVATGVYRTAGFELVEADHASKKVLGYVIGIASTEAATITRLNRSGMDHEAWRAAVGRRPRHPGRCQTMGSPLKPDPVTE